MKLKIICISLALFGALFGVVALSYSYDVYGGISKHTPPCAPITDYTVLMVFSLTITGVLFSTTAFFLARHRKLWILVSLTGLVLNLTAILIWKYWLATETLLPYLDWLEKTKMA